MKLEKLDSLTSEYITELAKNLLHKILWKNLNELFDLLWPIKYISVLLALNLGLQRPCMYVSCSVVSDYLQPHER